MGGAIRWQQVADQAEADFGRLEAHGLLLKFVDHVVLPLRQIVLARLAVGDGGARHPLQLDGDMLQHMPEPCPIFFGHAAYETARRVIRAGVLLQSGHVVKQPAREIAEPLCRVLLQLSQIHGQTDDRVEGIQVGSAKDAPVRDHHVGFPSILRDGSAMRVARSYRQPGERTSTFTPNTPIGP